MKKTAIFALILSTILLTLFVNIKTNSVVKIEVSYIEDTTQNELLNLTADVPKEILEYKEENNALRAFAGRKTFNYEDISFDYINSWTEVNIEEIKDPTFLINGRNAVFNVIKEQAPEKFTLDDYITSTKQVLEQALDDFCGTVIFISHDRYFINKISHSPLLFYSRVI